MTDNNITVFSAATSTTKWWFSIMLGILFFIFSLPAIYRVTSQVYSIVQGRPYETGDDCSETIVMYQPSINSVLVHAVLFTLFIRLLLS